MKTYTELSQLNTTATEFQFSNMPNAALLKFDVHSGSLDACYTNGLIPVNLVGQLEVCRISTRGYIEYRVTSGETYRANLNFSLLTSNSDVNWEKVITNNDLCTYNSTHSLLYSGFFEGNSTIEFGTEADLIQYNQIILQLWADSNFGGQTYYMNNKILQHVKHDFIVYTIADITNPGSYTIYAGGYVYRNMIALVSSKFLGWSKLQIRIYGVK